MILKTLNSLAKIYADRELDDRFIQNEGCMLQNEAFSFQVAFKLEENSDPAKAAFGFSVDIPEELKPYTKVKAIDYVPCDYTLYPRCLGLSDHPEQGLFPDILRSIPPVFWASTNSWRGVYITIDAQNACLKPGIYTIKTIFKYKGEYTKEFRIEVLDAMLPPQSIPVTNWFHTDCLCNYYHVEFDSKEYWRITENFAKTAVHYGINMLLMPIFTPPLDTAVGAERRTIQLIDVFKDGDTYTFDFKKLRKWVKMCKRVGVKYYEVSHLFTQWGCKYAPKVMATENGEYKRIFGWETNGHGEEYLDFLSQLLPVLIAELKKLGIFKKCYFHVSDEPTGEMKEDYGICSKFLREFISSDRIIDALSDISFYKEGLISCPVVGLDHVHTFVEEKVPTIWGYYCCGHDMTSNRFLALPAGQNRMLGLQLYKFNIKGFLQWGYNFYNSHLSLEEIDPYATSTAGGWVPGGDAYIVYPGADGNAVVSIRLEVFREALQDMRALEALESKFAAKVGKRKAHKAVIAALGLEDMTFLKFNNDGKYLVELREKINRLLVE
ncbi:MAG: DUF4091 domain-containing protein [Clostridia bacterium]|nr:DUF4091 domain-containing protein [Clostridia bacterium]